MKWILCLLLLNMIAVSNAQTIISLNDSTYSQVSMPIRNVEEVEDGIIVTYYFDNAIVQEDLLYPENIMWKIPGFGLNEIVGEPAIPSRKDMFSIPANAKIEVAVLDSSYVDFSMKLSPSRPILIDSDTIEHTLDNVLPINPYVGYFPNSLIKVVADNAYRGVSLLEVSISPLQYNYHKHVIRAYKMIKYKVSFLPQYKSHSNLVTIDDNDNFLSIATINSTSPKTKISERRNLTEEISLNRDYLIVTNSTLYPIAEEFAEWKRMLGFRTHVSINDSWSIQAVKDTVSHLYNDSNTNLYYLLILGDENVVPAKVTTYKTSSSSYNCITDTYYVCMDGEKDYIPDVYCGRIPVCDTLDAKTVLNKIRAYEEKPTLDSSFYNTGLNCAYYQDDLPPSNYADRRFAQTSEEIVLYVTSQGKSINRVYYTENSNTPLCWNNGTYGLGDSIPNYLRKPEFMWNGTSTDIINQINEGAFYVLHRDHGDVNFWGDPYFNQNHISNLTNYDKMPIVFSLNCLTGRYQESSTQDCFAESFLKKKDGGCVAIYAATGISFSGYNDALATGMFDAIWPIPGLRSIFPNSSNGGVISSTPSPTYELGQILEVGMIRMQETWGATRTSGANYTRSLFHLFGDPSMKIYTESPISIQNPQICRIDNTIYVDVNDGDALISFYTPSTKQVDSFLGNSISYQTTADDVIICISRHNCIPYIVNSNNLLYIQNETINNNRTYIGNTIMMGKNVTDKKMQGDVIINTGIIEFIGQKVLLKGGIRISDETRFLINTP